jgi:membrane protein DedA with SNARE-associated domain
LFESYSQQILTFIENHPESAFWIVLIVAFLESMAVVGVLVPGWLILLGVGALIGGGILPFYSMALAMFLGAVVGEGFSYFLGYHYRDRIRHWRWLESHQQALNKADNFMRRYGVLSLVIGRFIGPLRALLPLVAGVSGMSQKVFWSVNFGSGIMWAPLYLVPGILVGTALSLPEGSRELMAVFLLAEIVFLWLARKWWLDAARIKEQQFRLKLQSGLAITCCGLLIFIFVLSPVGQQVVQVFGQLLSVVA